MKCTWLLLCGVLLSAAAMASLPKRTPSRPPLSIQDAEEKESVFLKPHPGLGLALDYENVSARAYTLPAGGFVEGRKHGQRAVIVEGAVVVQRYRNPEHSDVDRLATYYELQFSRTGAEFVLRCSSQTCPGKLYQSNADLGFPLRPDSVYVYAKSDAVAPGKYVGVHVTPEFTYIVTVQGKHYAWARDLQRDRYDTIAQICFFGMIGALVFLGLNWRKDGFRIYPAIFPAVSFVLYLVYEYVLFDKGYNIRIDLLLIYPLLIATVLIAIVQQVRANAARRSTSSY